MYNMISPTQIIQLLQESVSTHSRVTISLGPHMISLKYDPYNNISKPLLKQIAVLSFVSVLGGQTRGN